MIKPCILDTPQAERDQREAVDAACGSVFKQEVGLDIEYHKGDGEDGRVGECVGLYACDVDCEGHGGDCREGRMQWLNDGTDSNFNSRRPAGLWCVVIVVYFVGVNTRGGC